LSRKYWTDPTKCDPMFSRMALKRFAGIWSDRIEILQICSDLDEVSNAVLMLLAPCSSMTTGATFPVDGGYTLL
jgi:enoyl-[acyl-carrier-protein] reductase (NADH)